jgi:hypothetical protein
MKVTSGFAEKAKQVVTYFQYGAPVWQLTQVDLVTDIDTRNHSTFEVKLGPLHEHRDFEGSNAWGCSIGFGTAPSSCLHIQPHQYSAFANMCI